LVLALWITLTTLQHLFIRLNIKGSGDLVVSLRKVPAGFYGMIVAHLGVAVFIVGIALTSQYSQEKDVRLEPGQKYQLGEYEFEFRGVTQIQEENYIASQGIVIVSRAGEIIQQMHPQKRIYRVQKMPMTEAAIDAGVSRDLFVALGERLDSKGAWSVRLYVKPFIRWIWIGAVIMSLGALLAAFDRRYRTVKVKSDSAVSDKEVAA
ncbi:MAG: c-type cytochrome biogenesis protein CcmF, partial [Gammaproteobacteria bacterium]|nr:c-type cytochrome biogenesis protein CcmF [Gammaproteobacteria bacterium]